MGKETLLEFRLRLNKDVPAYHQKGYEDTFYISIESLARVPIDNHWDIISVKELKQKEDEEINKMDSQVLDTHLHSNNLQRW